jgi:thiol-disulfide isomerase/thioredoxin
MTYLSAAIILIGAVSLMNLMLVLGVLRRLRTAAAASEPVDPSSFQNLRVGTRPDPFVVRMLAGGRLTEAALVGAGPTLVGFLSPGCGPCTDQLPLFAARAAEWPGGADRVLAVIADDTEDSAAFAEPLTGLANVVVDGLTGPVATAFGVTAFPSFGILDDTAAVVAQSARVDGLLTDPGYPARHGDPAGHAHSTAPAERATPAVA